MKLFSQTIVILLLIAILYLKANSAQYILPISASLALTWIAWLFSGRNSGTFRGSTVLFCAGLYPLSALLNALLPEQALQSRLWDQGVIGLWGYCLGILGLCAGFVGCNIVRGRLHRKLELGSQIGFSDVDVGKLDRHLWEIFALYSLSVVPASLGALFGGFYYHEYTDFDSANKWFFMGYFKYVMFAISALILQVHLVTRSRRSLMIFALTIAELIVSFGLSGSRTVIVMPLIYCFLYYAAFWNARVGPKVSAGMKATVGLVMVVFLLVVNSIWNQFQGTGAHVFRVGDRVASLMVAAETVGQQDSVYGNAGLLGHFAYRIQEYGWAGSAFEYFEGTELVGFQGFWNIIEFVLPSFLRTARYWESSELPQISVQINSDVTGGVAPLTTMGDFYRRFGWGGVFCGMLTISCILEWFDLYFSKSTIRTRLHLLMFWFHIGTCHLTLGIQEFLIQTIRPLFITWILSHLLCIIINQVVKEEIQPVIARRKS